MRPTGNKLQQYNNYNSVRHGQGSKLSHNTKQQTPQHNMRQINQIKTISAAQQNAISSGEDMDEDEMPEEINDFAEEYESPSQQMPARQNLNINFSNRYNASMSNQQYGQIQKISARHQKNAMIQKSVKTSDLQKQRINRFSINDQNNFQMQKGAKQTQTQKNSTVRKIELLSSLSPAAVSGSSMQGGQHGLNENFIETQKTPSMIQHLPPSVVLNSKKSKITASAYVSPTSTNSLLPTQSRAQMTVKYMKKPGVTLVDSQQRKKSTSKPMVQPNASYHMLKKHKVFTGSEKKGPPSAHPQPLSVGSSQSRIVLKKPITQAHTLKNSMKNSVCSTPTNGLSVVRISKEQETPGAVLNIDPQLNEKLQKIKFSTNELKESLSPRHYIDLRPAKADEDHPELHDDETVLLRKEKKKQVQSEVQSRKGSINDLPKMQILNLHQIQGGSIISTPSSSNQFMKYNKASMSMYSQGMIQIKKGDSMNPTIESERLAETAHSKRVFKAKKTENSITMNEAKLGDHAYIKRKPFVSKTAQVSAQVSAHVSAVVSKNNSNNSSQVRTSVNQKSSSKLQMHHELGTALKALNPQKRELDQQSNIMQSSIGTSLQTTGLKKNMQSMISSMVSSNKSGVLQGSLSSSIQNQSQINQNNILKNNINRLKLNPQTVGTSKMVKNQMTLKSKIKEKIMQKQSSNLRMVDRIGKSAISKTSKVAAGTPIRGPSPVQSIQTQKSNKLKQSELHMNEPPQSHTGEVRILDQDHYNSSGPIQNQSRKKHLQPSQGSKKRVPAPSAEAHMQFDDASQTPRDQGIDLQSSAYGSTEKQRMSIAGQGGCSTAQASNFAPQVSFCEQIDEQNESESREPLEKIYHIKGQQPDEKKKQKVKIAFNIQEDIYHQQQSSVRSPSRSKDGDVASETSSQAQIKEYYKDIKKLKKQIQMYFKEYGSIKTSSCDFYRIGRVLGRGAFGKVNLACHKVCEHLIAIKSIDKKVLRNEKEQKKRVMQEMAILKQSDHDNVVRLYDSFETQKHICFVMELCQGGDLLTYVRKRRRLKEDNAKYLFKQLVEGLHYIHTKKFVVHRDIKLDNILLDQSGRIKICDFGVSRQVRSEKERMHDQCGTPAYIAPEILKNRGYKGFKVDMWSAGVCLYVMLVGTVPFRASKMSQLHDMIKKGKFDLQGETVSDEALDLLKKLINVDYKNRLSALETLQHPWLKSTQDGKELIRTNRADLEDVIFTDKEKENIKRDYLYRLEKIKQKRFVQVTKPPIIQQQKGHMQSFIIKTDDPFQPIPGDKRSSMTQNISRLISEGDLIFTEHALDTKEDEKNNHTQIKQVQNFFKEDEVKQTKGQFTKFSGLGVVPKKDKQEDLKNMSEQSMIYAPFNSSFSDYNEDVEFIWPQTVIQNLFPKKSKIIKFSKKCRDLNREYEQNNNADLDNGVYNAFVNEQEMEAEQKQIKQHEDFLKKQKELHNKQNVDQNSIVFNQPKELMMDFQRKAMGVGGAQYQSLNSNNSNSNDSLKSNDDGDIHDETELSSDSEHAMEKMRARDATSRLQQNEGQISEANELSIHESMQKINEQINNSDLFQNIQSSDQKSAIKEKFQLDENIVNYSLKLFKDNPYEPTENQAAISQPPKKGTHKSIFGKINQAKINQLRSSKIVNTYENEMRKQLIESLQQQKINYLTAAYFLTKKHEFQR